MTADPGELARLADQVRPVAPADRGRRVGAVPTLPAAAGAASRLRQVRRSWRVAYLLQAIDDLSLLVPAEAAWKERGREAAVLGRDGFRPREYLLSALGQAATLCPRIEASLKAAAPAGYDLDAAGAHEFLSDKAGSLEQAGLRRVPARVVEPQGDQAATGGPGGRRVTRS